MTPVHSTNFEALGTSWEVASKRDIADETIKRITRALALFELTYSRFIGDSTVSVAAHTPGTYTFPTSAEDIFAFYEQLYELTNGKVTPLIGDTLSSAGYDAQYSLKPSEMIQAAAPYEQVVRRDGHDITLTKAALLDVGAVGKGYAVDMVMEMLVKDGHDAFVVDASGDMRVVGDMTESIGLENPNNPEEVIGAITLENRALCASASNRRVWGEWHHIIDPDTALPTRDVIATWVIADTTMIADGLATALFFVSPQTLATKYTYEYMRMHADGSVEFSDYFAGSIYS